MDNSPSNEEKNQTTETPAPEVLTPRVDDVSTPEGSEPSATPPIKPSKRPHGPYRPSHKATFVALGVIIVILGVNAGIIAFVLKGQGNNSVLGNQDEVTISQAALDKVGVNRNSVGDSGLELVVSPNARFNGKVKMGGNVSIGGQLTLNSKFQAAEASLTQLAAGDTALDKLNVNGDSSFSNANLRGNLAVNGTTKLQGAVTISQLLTVNNSLNVSGNLAVGGTLSASNLSVRSLNIDSTLTIGGHIITRGLSPTASAGGGVGTSGTISISGNDASGTVVVNIGGGAAGGTLANVTFRNAYTGTPHVVITPIGAGVGNFYINRSQTGFNIATSGPLSPGTYAFDYIVMQ